MHACVCVYICVFKEIHFKELAHTYVGAVKL